MFWDQRNGHIALIYLLNRRSAMCLFVHKPNFRCQAHIQVQNMHKIDLTSVILDGKAVMECVVCIFGALIMLHMHIHPSRARALFYHMSLTVLRQFNVMQAMRSCLAMWGGGMQDKVINNEYCMGIALTKIASFEAGNRLREI